MKALIFILLSLVSVHTLAIVCSITNGTAANVAACTCGSVECASTTGLICYSTYGGGSCRKTGLGAFGYPKEAGNTTCGSMTNRAPILDKALCEAAATSMGLNDVTATEYSSSNAPPGCFWHSNRNQLQYNTATSTRSCTHNSNFCLCIAASDCTQTNGATSNTDTCLCGGTGCTATTGQFCTKSTNSCSPFAPCSVLDGSAANDASCACGTSDCTAATNGLFCTKSTNSCSPFAPCTVTNGTAANLASCACGTADCTDAYNGLFCTSSTNTCTNGEKLAVTSGSGCTASGNCFQSLNFPNKYGGSESCSVTVQSVLAGETLSSVAFNTEQNYDKLIVGGTTYSGTSGPSNVTVSVNDVITWSSDYVQEGSGFQVCLVAACLQTNGSQVNSDSDACGCGTAVCTAAGGLFCTSSTNTCRHAPCSVVDGTSVNSESCACGTSDCTAASNGLFCTSSTNTCSSYVSCSDVDGTSVNSESCACGTSDCTAATNGLFCTSSTNSCSSYVSCSDVDGSSVNSESCACGTSDCTAATNGLFCTSSTNSCSPFAPCSVLDGSAANDASCACGTSDCTAATNGLFCTKSTNSCSPFAPCTVTNGTAANLASCACGTADCTDAYNRLFCTSSTNTCTNGEKLAVTTGSGCTASGNCFQSLNFPNKYGSSETCSVTVQRVLAGETLYSVAFNTESGWDKLIVGGTWYSGTSGLSNVDVSVNDVITWSSDSIQERSGFQVCLVAACLQTDGSQVNSDSDACGCGTAVCTAAGGLFCTSATNSCSQYVSCSVTNGSAANLASCACGTTACTAATGLFCDADADTCSLIPSCTNTNGSAANPASCVCGTAGCTAASNGLFCDTSTNTCSQYVSCSVVDGSAANDASCACGFNDCTDSNELVCNAQLSDCGPECASFPVGTKVSVGTYVSCFVTSVTCSGALDMCANNTAAVKTWYNGKNNC